MLGSMAELLLIRHGQSRWNVERRFQGQHPDAPGLSDDGHAQAQALAVELTGQPADAIVTSDLTRAIETGSYLEQAWGVDAVRSPLLREGGVGVFEGLTADEIESQHPGMLEGFFNGGERPPGSESMSTIEQRAVAAVDWLAQQARGGRIAAVSHGMFMRLLITELSDTPFEDTIIVSNCSVTRLNLPDA